MVLTSARSREILTRLPALVFRTDYTGYSHAPRMLRPCTSDLVPRPRTEQAASIAFFPTDSEAIILGIILHDQWISIIRPYSGLAFSSLQHELDTITKITPKTLFSLGNTMQRISQSRRDLGSDSWPRHLCLLSQRFVEDQKLPVSAYWIPLIEHCVDKATQLPHTSKVSQLCLYSLTRGIFQQSNSSRFQASISHFDR
ncbi:hypothetical protein K490DRAFT_53570 [Saccharata proteae CBS 121410]|uniref:Uncharacterized protein n=1 Tax=Saccharata proteae CBS 121410 TaxID=1314787 RepID=A0A9P4I0M2_9PEZI|nr:hypothetical protein K490DRAFT_53570 [Saccharata proteae CBS 121410]